MFFREFPFYVVGVVTAAVVNATVTPGVTLSSMVSGDSDVVNNVTSEAVATCVPGECAFGLQNDMQVRNYANII